MSEKTSEKILKQLEQQNRHLANISTYVGFIAGVISIVVTMAVLALIHQQYHWF
jgi:hypothetical protein